MGVASSINNVGSQTIGVTASFFGAIGATFTCSFDLTRMGNLVFLNSRDNSVLVTEAAAAGATSTILAADVIPEGYRPTGATVCVYACKVINNSAETVGILVVPEDGGLIVQRDVGGTDFATTGDNGFVPPAVFWKS